MEISIVLGQGIAGSTLAWFLHWAGHEVHVVDRGEPQTASKIAAGLITPITGQRFVKAEDFDRCRTISDSFYRKVEAVTGQKIFDEAPSVRMFRDDNEREFFLRDRLEQYQDEIELISVKGTAVGFRMLKAARLRVQDYLTATREFFLQLGHFHDHSVNALTDIELRPDGVKLSPQGIECDRLIFCQGYQQQPNPWFPGIPDAPVRGEILKVRVPDRNDVAVEHRGYWFAPVLSTALSRTQEEAHSPHEYLIGATYDRTNLKGPVDDSGRQELLSGLKEFQVGEFTVTDHFSAVRASTMQRRPIVAVHSEYRQLAILNGMGSRASQLAPVAAQELVELMKTQDGRVNKEQQETGRKKAVSLTTLAHNILRRVIRAGDTVVDATAGNGYDTLNLARSVTETGRVLAIDIQPAAIAATRDRLRAASVQHVSLFEEDHTQVLQRLAEAQNQVRAIMFNLGYLPGSDKQHTTTAQSTTTAMVSALKILAPGGVMTVTAYRGHPGGQEEAAAVEHLAKSQTPQQISVDVIPGSVENQESPILYVFRNREADL